jgi:hypothetical protein
MLSLEKNISKAINQKLSIVQMKIINDWKEF